MGTFNWNCWHSKASGLKRSRLRNKRNYSRPFDCVAVNGSVLGIAGWVRTRLRVWLLIIRTISWIRGYVYKKRLLGKWRVGIGRNGSNWNKVWNNDKFSNFHYQFCMQNRKNHICDPTSPFKNSIHHPKTRISIPQKRNGNLQWSTSPDLFKWLSFRASNSWAVLARPLLMTLEIISSRNFFSLHSPYFILFLLFHVPFC